MDRASIVDLYGKIVAAHDLGEEKNVIDLKRLIDVGRISMDLRTRRAIEWSEWQHMMRVLRQARRGRTFQ